MPENHFSKCLRQWLFDQGYGSQERLARVTGFSGGHLSKLANGTMMGSKRARQIIAQAIGMDYEVINSLPHDEDVAARESGGEAVGRDGPVQFRPGPEALERYPDLAKYVRLADDAAKVDPRLAAEVFRRIADYLQGKEQESIETCPKCGGASSNL